MSAQGIAYAGGTASADVYRDASLFACACGFAGGTSQASPGASFSASGGRIQIQFAKSLLGTDERLLCFPVDEA